jgi:hypothetical protein
MNSPSLELDHDIALHISTRLDQSCIVRNSYQNDTWGNEERSGTFRIDHYEYFEMAILAEWDRYKIAVDGEHIADFSHRFPMHFVQYMSVKGSVKVEHVMIEQLQGSWP